jgi:hypothetical protein
MVQRFERFQSLSWILCVSGSPLAGLVQFAPVPVAVDLFVLTLSARVSVLSCVIGVDGLQCHCSIALALRVYVLLCRGPGITSAVLAGHFGNS